MKTVKIACMIASSVCLLLAQAGFALVVTHSGGIWPETWPAEMEPLRQNSRTLDIAAGNQEVIYEIPFKNRESFEHLWPIILSLKTPGAPLKIERLKAHGTKSQNQLLTYGEPLVRIYAPVRTGVRKTDEDKRLLTGPPWPKSIVSSRGELPEYVQNVQVNDKSTWVAAELGKGNPGFYYRARVDLELVVDGRVIDLNRIALPADTPIVDKRWPSVKDEK